MQKGKGLRRKKESETRDDPVTKLTDDEKSDIVSQAIENLQKDIDEASAMEQTD